MINSDSFYKYREEYFFKLVISKQYYDLGVFLTGKKAISNYNKYRNEAIIKNGLDIIYDRFKDIDIDYKIISFKESFELYEMYYGEVKKDSFEYQCIHQVLKS